MLAFWDQFGEIFGMPIRIGKTISREEKEKSKIAKMLEQMGSSSWAVFDEGTEIEIKESAKGDAFNVYDKRIDRANTEISKAILGATMTIDDGSSKSQATVHENVLTDISYADADFLRDIVNDKLIPFINKHGFGFEGYRFDWDDTYEYNPVEMIKIEELMINNFEIDYKYFIEKYNIPILGPKKQGGIIDMAPKPDPEKKKLSLNSELITLVNETYQPCPDCGGSHLITLASNDEMDTEAGRIAQMIFDGEAFEGGIDEQVASRVAERLREAMIQGFGSDFPAIDYNTPDSLMLSNLENNCYNFSVAKNYNELKQATLLLKNGDKVRSFSEYKAEVSKLHRVFNVDWMETEYNTAINSAEMASKWAGFQQNKGAMGMLRYVTVGDTQVRASHQALDGIQRKVDDPFWNGYYPPNGWRCRCTVNQTGQGAQTDLKKKIMPEMQLMFKTNMAKTGVLFPDGHAYYKDFPEEAKTQVIKVQRKTISKWARENITGKDIELKFNELSGNLKISGTAIDEAINQPHPYPFEKNRLLYNLKSVINASTYDGSALDIKGNPLVKQFHYLKTEVKDQPTWIVIREMSIGKKKESELQFYSITDHDPKKKA